MENKDKPAFSVTIKDNGNPTHPTAMGLSKREYFAAIAMQGLLACRYPISKEDIARESVSQADELLKALEKYNKE